MTDLPINKIVCGDNVATMATFPAESIDLVVTSPPYDNLRTYGGHTWDFEGVAQQLWRVIKTGGVVVWVVNDATVNGSETGTSFRQALRFMEIGFRLHDTMIWERTCPFPESTRYRPNFEYMFVLSNGSPKSFNPIMDRKVTTGTRSTPPQERQPDGRIIKPNRDYSAHYREYAPRFNTWKHVNGSTNGTSDLYAYKHPAVFPEGIARDHIISWSNEGDIVLDPFSGSGTTAKMAKHNGRRYIGIEINPEYCEIAAKRLEQGVLEFSDDPMPLK
jgi:site-specific DNA-methyltransferase (adenine-specific)